MNKQIRGKPAEGWPSAVLRGDIRIWSAKAAPNRPPLGAWSNHGESQAAWTVPVHMGISRSILVLRPHKSTWISSFLKFSRDFPFGVRIAQFASRNKLRFVKAGSNRSKKPAGSGAFGKRSPNRRAQSDDFTVDRYIQGAGKRAVPSGPGKIPPGTAPDRA